MDQRERGIHFPYFTVLQLMARIILESIRELLLETERARTGATRIEFLYNG